MGWTFPVHWNGWKDMSNAPRPTHFGAMQHKAWPRSRPIAPDVISVAPQGASTMNQHAKIDTAATTKMSPEEWQARVDLAAVYRVFVHYGWGHHIFTRVTQ